MQKIRCRESLISLFCFVRLIVLFSAMMQVAAIFAGLVASAAAHSAMTIPEVQIKPHAAISYATASNCVISIDVRAGTSLRLIPASQRRGLLPQTLGWWCAAPAPFRAMVPHPIQESCWGELFHDGPHMHCPPAHQRSRANRHSSHCRHHLIMTAHDVGASMLRTPVIQALPTTATRCSHD